MSRVHFIPTKELMNKANELFQSEKNKIKTLLPFADIQHIGSTVIPGSVTKGDLDIVVRVTKEEFNRSVEILKSMYKVNQPENWSETFASFKANTLEMDFGAQLVVIDSLSDDFHKLHDILKTNSQLLKEYNAMKLKYEGKNMNDYRKEKADFFQKLRNTL